jgi:hypothetical protein
MYERPRSEDFYRWSLLDAPGHRAIVAVEGDECHAMLRAFDREYLFGDRRLLCRETFDWVCVPERRREALGLRVMRAAMDEWGPLVNVGGSEDTLGMLPALRWLTIGTADSYALPLRRQLLDDLDAEQLQRLQELPRRARGPALTAATALWFRPRRRSAPAGGDVVPVASVGPEILELYDGDVGYGAVGVPDPDHLRWLTSGFSGAGQFAAYYFTIGGRLRGWGLNRLYAAGGTRRAAVVHVYAPRPTVELYTWMVSELLVRAQGNRPAAIRTQASCPILQQVLKRLRFVRHTAQPVFFWSPTEAAPESPLHFTLIAQDSPMLPYDPDWTFDRPAEHSVAATLEQTADYR